MEEINDLYVVGFPKSGNTWLARLIAEVTDSYIGIEDAGDVINNADNKTERKGKFKIHKQHGYKNYNEIVNSKKIIYIVRDVRDTMVSGFFFNNPMFNENQITNNYFIKKYFNFEIKRLNDKWQGNFLINLKTSIKKFINNMLGRMNVYGNVGNWSEHIHKWTNNPNTIVVKYEDLLIDAKKELQRILNFLNLKIDESKIDEVIENQSFEKKKCFFIENGDTVNAKFMRSGKSGKWKFLLDNEITMLIESKHKVMMDKYNYK